MPDRANHASLDHAVHEKFAGNEGNLLRIDQSFDQVTPRGHNSQFSGQTQVGGLRGHLAAGHIWLTGGGIDVNFPQHREFACPP